MASIGLTGGAFYGHFLSKEASFAELVEHEISNSADMLAGAMNPRRPTTSPKGCAAT